MIKQEIVNTLVSINDLRVLQLIELHSVGVVEWKNNKSNRQWFTKNYSIVDITIKTILKRLLDQGYLNKIRRGVYKINPDIIC